MDMLKMNLELFIIFLLKEKIKKRVYIICFFFNYNLYN